MISFYYSYCSYLWVAALCYWITLNYNLIAFLVFSCSRVIITTRFRGKRYKLCNFISLDQLITRRQRYYQLKHNFNLLIFQFILSRRQLITRRLRVFARMNGRIQSLNSQISSGMVLLIELSRPCIIYGLLFFSAA